MSEQTVFSIAVGDGEMAIMSRYLVRSIRECYPGAPVLALATESEIGDIDRETVDFFHTHTDLRVASIPEEEYFVSAKLLAMCKASKTYDFRYLVLLDSDTVVLGELEPYLESMGPGEVYVKPADVARRWTGDEEWRAICDTLDFAFPDRETTTTVDEEPIFPFYNAGVVATTVSEFPRDWLELTLDTHEAAAELFPTTNNSRFSDQVALGLLNQRYRFVEIPETLNYPLHLRPGGSGAPVVLHYHSVSQLDKIEDESTVARLERIGITTEIPRFSFDNAVWNWSVDLLGTLGSEVLKKVKSTDR